MGAASPGPSRPPPERADGGAADLLCRTRGARHQCRGHSCCESQRFHSRLPVSRKPFHTVGVSHVPECARVRSLVCRLVGARRALGRATASTGHKTSAEKAAQNCTRGRNREEGRKQGITGRRQTRTCRTSLDVLLQCIPAQTSQARRLREVAETADDTKKTQRWVSRPGQQQITEGP